MDKGSEGDVTESSLGKPFNHLVLLHRNMAPSGCGLMTNEEFEESVSVTVLLM